MVCMGMMSVRFRECSANRPSLASSRSLILGIDPLVLNPQSSMISGLPEYNLSIASLCSTS